MSAKPFHSLRRRIDELGRYEPNGQRIVKGMQSSERSRVSSVAWFETQLKTVRLVADQDGEANHSGGDVDVC